MLHGGNVKEIFDYYMENCSVNGMTNKKFKIMNIVGYFILIVNAYILFYAISNKNWALFTISMTSLILYLVISINEINLYLKEVIEVEFDSYLFQRGKLEKHFRMNLKDYLEDITLLDIDFLTRLSEVAMKKSNEKKIKIIDKVFMIIPILISVWLLLLNDFILELLSYDETFMLWVFFITYLIIIFIIWVFYTASLIDSHLNHKSFMYKRFSIFIDEIIIETIKGNRNFS